MKQQQKTVLQAIIAFIFGQKYYVNVFNRRGTPMCEVSSFIFQSKKDAIKHKQSVEASPTFNHVETITFRSRNLYRVGTFNRMETTILVDEDAELNIQSK